jgi:DNA polymerase III delta prime subunit
MEVTQREYIYKTATELAKLSQEEGLDFLAYLLELAAREAISPNTSAAAATSPALPDASYLREQATRFIRLARQHREFPVSHDLEIISVELMEKAAQLEGYLADHSAA